MKKSYDYLYRTRCMEILWVYGIGTNLQWILGRYWEEQRVVPWTRRCYELSFKTGRGLTKGGLVSPTIFNIVVDAVVQEVLWFAALRRPSTGWDGRRGSIKLCSM